MIDFMDSTSTPATEAATEPARMLPVVTEQIGVRPGFCGGKSHILGHRIKVKHVAIWHERLGKSADEIAAEYDLTLADIYAALAYYFDHRVEIDKSIEEGEAFADALRRRTPSKVRQKLQERKDNGPAD